MTAIDGPKAAAGLVLRCTLSGAVKQFIQVCLARGLLPCVGCTRLAAITKAAGVQSPGPSNLQPLLANLGIGFQGLRCALEDDLTVTHHQAALRHL